MILFGMQIGMMIAKIAKDISDTNKKRNQNLGIGQVESGVGPKGAPSSSGAGMNLIGQLLGQPGTTGDIGDQLQGNIQQSAQTPDSAFGAFTQGGIEMGGVESDAPLRGLGGNAGEEGSGIMGMFSGGGGGMGGLFGGGGMGGFFGGGGGGGFGFGG